MNQINTFIPSNAGQIQILVLFKAAVMLANFIDYNLKIGQATFAEFKRV